MNCRHFPDVLARAPNANLAPVDNDGQGPGDNEIEVVVVSVLLDQNGARRQSNELTLAGECSCEVLVALDQLLDGKFLKEAALPLFALKSLNQSHAGPSC